MQSRREPKQTKYIPPHMRGNRQEDGQCQDGKQFLYIIRHGDRWDEENPSYKTNALRPLDTPLSQLGHNQARETGQLLDHAFRQDGISAECITWLSSPFLRCLQTSQEALNALTIPHAGGIRILPEMAISEWGANHAKQLPPLTERQHYFPQLDCCHQSMFTPHSTENYDVFVDRCRRAATSIHKRYPYHPNTAIVLVSHAAPSLNIAESLAGLT